MKPLDWHYKRPELAEGYLKQVGLGPVFRIALLGVRRIGKTAFLIKDIIPKAEELGFHPVYINMWDNRDAPHETIISKLNDHIKALSSSSKESIKQLMKSEVTKFEINAGVAKATIDTSTVKPQLVSPSHVTQISDALIRLNKLADAADKRLLFILDEIQHLNSTNEFIPIQSCLRTNFDTYHETSVIFAGSSRGGVAAMFNTRSENFKVNGKTEVVEMPFFDSARLTEFPLLDSGFVEYLMGVVKSGFDIDSFDVDELERCFQAYDYSPFWFRRLLEQLISRTLTLEDAHKSILLSIREHNRIDEIIKKMNLIDKLVYLRLYCDIQPLSSDSVNWYMQQIKSIDKKDISFDKARNSATASIRKLERNQIVTIHQNEYFFEITGLQDAIKENLESLI
ncbi:hypothetical protein QX249_11470 [Vibrio parahaemolyticus]|uniref:ATPase domain-containing protein n=1 Tax=Vibrio parahaemolyticus TaxID=670 RepID=A0AAW8Q0U6_VIBPH|nr:hypothetical protein [Vibrio parahaemolyticus]MDS1821284.1 hypothetical protein [Vibrio parahaemolyticus]